ncbi:efflux RND transporter permease subunit, partial [Stenotrophomonas sp. 3diitr2024]|uniref:efflux RND transporter permease subunit n=1 Tax=Stenotrophomonas sp. 3diitr2024 TaxID=3345115 RepID=UPI0035CBDA21
GGAAGEIYKQFALTIAISMAFSAFLALGFTPALCATFLNSSIAMFIGIGFAVVMTRLFRSVGAEWTARRTDAPIGVLIEELRQRNDPSWQPTLARLEGSPEPLA